MKASNGFHHGAGVQQSVAEHAGDVTGVISGYERLKLRGSLRDLFQPSFMRRYLCNVGVLLKNFGAYASSLSDRVRDAAHAFAARLLSLLDGRAQRGTRPGARRARPHHARTHRRLRLRGAMPHVLRPRRLHHYFYFQHAELGLMHLRLQT